MGHETYIMCSTERFGFEREKSPLGSNLQGLHRGPFPRAFIKGHLERPLSSTVKKSHYRGSLSRNIVTKGHYEGWLLRTTIVKIHYQLTLSNIIVKVKWTWKLVMFAKDWNYFSKLGSTEEVDLQFKIWKAIASLLNVRSQKKVSLVVSSINPVPADSFST